MKGHDEINSSMIAKIAGVSRSTVSRVINNYSNVPQETREKVMAVIEQTGYCPNNAAQMLAGKKGDNIGLFWIANEPLMTSFSSNIFFVSIIEQATRMGCSVLTYVLPDLVEEKNIQRVRSAFYHGKIEGAVFIGCRAYEPVVEALVAEGYFVGIMEQDEKGHDEPNRIIVNFDSHTSSQAVDYLAGLQHRSIGILYGSLERYGGIQKFNGFMNGFVRNGLVVRSEWFRCCKYTEQSSYDAMMDILKNVSQYPTAFCCANDLIAYGAIHALKDFGLEVPGDVSVVGLDDHEASVHFTPPITTFRYDFVNIMQTLTKRLIQAINGEEPDQPKHFTVYSEFVERESCRRLSE